VSALSAQTASQITPPTFAPPASPTTAAPLVIPQGAGAKAPPGSEGVTVKLGDVTVAGLAEDTDALADLKARLVGHSITVAEIFAAAHDLEARHARAGQVLVRVTVPPQSLAEGATLRLVAVAGYIERVDTSHLPKRVSRRVAAILARLVGRPDINLATIERGLMLAADTPGLSLRSTLAAGTLPGATILVIEGTHRPVTAFLTFDNMLPSALGTYGFGAGITFNSVLGLGETVYLRASGLPNLGQHTSFLDPTPRNRALAAGVIVPIGHDGLSLNVEGTDARAAPRHDALFPGFGSRFQRLSTRLHYPLVRSRALTIAADAILDVQDERVRIIDPLVLPISLDRLRIARGSTNLSYALPGGGIVTARAILSVGMNALGARSAADATPILPLSRFGSDAAFHKIEGDLSLDRPLARHLAIALKAHAQSSMGEVLANSEQIGIATADGISTLGSGSLQGDSGYVVRGELRAPFSHAIGTAWGEISPYGFGALGRVHYVLPTFFERSSTSASAYGVGLRLNGALHGGTPGIAASIEYGRGHIQGVSGHPDRLSVTFITQF